MGIWWERIRWAIRLQYDSKFGITFFFQKWWRSGWRCFSDLNIYLCVMTETCQKLLLWEEHTGVCYLLKQILRMDGWCCLIAKLCMTLSQPVDCSLSGSSVHGISQARILEWVPFPSPGDLPDPETEPASPAWQVDSLLLSHQWSSENNIWKIIRWAVSCWVRRMVLKHLGNLYKAFCS